MTEAENEADILPQVTEKEPPEENPDTPNFNEAAIRYKPFNSEFRIMEKVMTIGQLTLSRKPEIRQGVAVLVSTYPSNTACIFLSCSINNGVFNETISVDHIDKCKINRCTDIIDARGLFSTDWNVAVLYGPQLKKEPKKARYKIEEVFGTTLIELAKLAPNNPTLRSHLNAIFRTPPPPELDTFQKLKDWMEMDFDKPVLSLVHARQYGIPEARSGRLQPAHRPPPAIAFGVKFKQNCIQSGSCLYTAKMENHGEVSIHQSQIIGMVRDGMSVDSMVGEIMERTTLEASNEVDNAVVSGHEYSSYVLEKSDDQTTEIDKEKLNHSLVLFLRRHYGASEAQTILER